MEAAAHSYTGTMRTITPRYRWSCESDVNIGTKPFDADAENR
jgi:hypothetical protein